MFNILPEIHQTLCYIVHDKSKANPERDLMDLTTSVTDHIFVSFQGGNNKKGRKYTKKCTNENYCKFGLSRDKCDILENFPC